MVSLLSLTFTIFGVIFYLAVLISLPICLVWIVWHGASPALRICAILLVGMAGVLLLACARLIPIFNARSLHAKLSRLIDQVSGSGKPHEPNATYGIHHHEGQMGVDQFLNINGRH